MSLKIANVNVTALHDHTQAAAYRIMGTGENNRGLAMKLFEASKALHEAIETTIPRREFIRGYDPTPLVEIEAGVCDFCEIDTNEFTDEDQRHRYREPIASGNALLCDECVTQYTECEGCHGFGIECSSDGAPPYCDDCEPMFEEE